MAEIDEVPLPVLDAARERQLGELVIAADGMDNKLEGGCLIVLAVLAAGISAAALLLGTAIPFLDLRMMLAIGIAMAVLAVLGVVRGVLSMLASRPAYFLFTGGLVQRKGRGQWAVAWPDVRTITVRSSSIGEIVTRTGFQLKLADGKSRPVRIGDHLPDQKAFTAAFEQAVGEAGLPVVG
ncbi:hypothetical protein [Pseudonocardia lacus]|uniref:hypothetical protein n=1 Tax=Pseudonocardia lacus TaxID=2835865 RepID=UPI001BDD3CFD|nr:hypothetical protein [Pseudonocardia lacus]